MESQVRSHKRLDFEMPKPRYVSNAGAIYMLLSRTWLRLAIRTKLSSDDTSQHQNNRSHKRVPPINRLWPVTNPVNQSPPNAGSVSSQGPVRIRTQFTLQVVTATRLRTPRILRPLRFGFIHPGGRRQYHLAVPSARIWAVARPAVTLTCYSRP